MLFSQIMKCSGLYVAVGMVQLYAATVYNETVSGDLSNSGLSPSVISLGPGSNQIFGSTGRGTVIDRDYFTVNIGAGLDLVGITVLPGTQSGGAVSFIGLQAGSQVTVSTAATDATGLLGWWHYGPSDINTNILPEMAVPSMGSSGFKTPLGPGSYSFWIQDFNSGTFNYGFDLQVATAPVGPAPEPGTLGTVLVGAGILIGAIRRRAASSARI